MNFSRLHIKCTSESCCLQFQQTTCHKTEKKKTFLCAVAFNQRHSEWKPESVSSSPVSAPAHRTFRAQCGILSSQTQFKLLRWHWEPGSFFVVVFVLLTELSLQNETFHQASATSWKKHHSLAGVSFNLFIFSFGKKKRNLNKGFMKRTKAKPRTNTERFGPHFFLLASQLPFTVPTCTSQGSRQARPERDANLSWHIKLRLARITELTATNGQAERLSSRAEGPHQIRLPAGACDLGGVHHVVAYWRDC